MINPFIVITSWIHLNSPKILDLRVKKSLLRQTKARPRARCCIVLTSDLPPSPPPYSPNSGARPRLKTQEHSRGRTQDHSCGYQQQSWQYSLGLRMRPRGESSASLSTPFKSGITPHPHPPLPLLLQDAGTCRRAQPWASELRPEEPSFGHGHKY